MCGIAGAIRLKNGDEQGFDSVRTRLTAMMDAMVHRGPDDWGMAFVGLNGNNNGEENPRIEHRHLDSAQVALGHRRLSILDLSPAGRQPMSSADGFCLITFNGEIYNYIELREELAKRAEFRTGTDTEVLLEAYRQWGVGMLERLDGMFAFALWDSRARKLICARDPLGIKPFYFAEEGGWFYFASEPRAVLAGLNTRGHVDWSRVAEYLVLGLSDHDEGTSFLEVRELRGGHWMEIDAHGACSSQRAYWTPPREVDGDGDIPAQIRAEIDLAITRQMRADVPIGSCLSGGLDSGSIVATVGKLFGKNAGAFTSLTLKVDDFEGNEAAQACAIAANAGLNWQPVELDTSHATRDLDHLVEVMGEPFGSLSMLGQYLVMREAKARNLKVMLDGQGGDEVFLGYPRIAQRVVGSYFRQGLFQSAWQEWKGLQENASWPLAASLLGNAYFASPNLVLRQSQRRLKGLVDPEVLHQVRHQTLKDRFANKSVVELQIGELCQYVLPRLLRYEDRNSMAFSIEARVPLLSVKVVEKALRLPLNWKVRNGWTKYALRAGMADRLPEEVVWHRRKRGFEVPQARWVEPNRTHIAAWARECPSDIPINIGELVNRIEANQIGQHWTWRCLSVALWMRSTGVRA